VARELCQEALEQGFTPDLEIGLHRHMQGSTPDLEVGLGRHVRALLVELLLEALDLLP